MLTTKVSQQLKLVKINTCAMNRIVYSGNASMYIPHGLVVRSVPGDHTEVVRSPTGLNSGELFFVQGRKIMICV